MLVPCLNCYTVVRVMDDVTTLAILVGNRSEYWPDKYTCVACGKNCTAISEGDAAPEALQRMKLRDLNAEEFLAALSGLGTPDEMICDAVTVTDLLAKKIKTVNGYNIPNTTRFLLESLELEDGTKLHFGAGALGACVYRITRPISYVAKALAHE